MSSKPVLDPGWRPKVIVLSLLTSLLDLSALWTSCVPSGRIADAHRWRDSYLNLMAAPSTYIPYDDLLRQAAKAASIPDSVPKAVLHNWSSLLPFPEVADVLTKLHQQGYMVAVVTNTSRQLGRQAISNLETIVRAQTGMEWKVDAMVTAEDSGVFKPARQAYDAILPELGAGVTRADVLYVVGVPSEVQGAADAGFKVAWHNHLGLSSVGDAKPVKEGTTLDRVLEEFLS